MGRKIIGVIAGYVIMFVLVFVTFTITYLLLGTDGAFQAGTYQVSAAWIAASIILSLIAAIIGGLACRTISRSSGASMTLAGIVLVFGLAMAVPTLSAEDNEAVRTEEVGAMEAMQSAQQPPWLAFLNPVIGTAGVMIGARMKRGATP